jgi:phosphatidylserine/phosphatidylglycerophosphate/cardiolipin synthase-like enzyme
MTIRRFASDSNQTFHPKVWIFSLPSGAEAAIVGSSNLTRGGLDCNLEANVLVDDGVVEELEGFFDELFEGGRAKHISTMWLDSYRELWKEQQAARTRLDSLLRKDEDYSDALRSEDDGADPHFEPLVRLYGQDSGLAAGIETVPND